MKERADAPLTPREAIACIGSKLWEMDVARGANGDEPDRETALTHAVTLVAREHGADALIPLLGNLLSKAEDPNHTTTPIVIVSRPRYNP